MSTAPLVLPGRPRGLVRQQLPYLCRALLWRPIVGFGAAGALLAVADLPSALVIASVASGLSCVLDDPAAAILDATPASRPRRLALRLGLALPFVVVLWLGAVQPVWSFRPAAPAVGAAALALAALVAVVLAGAAAGGSVAGATLALTVAVAGASLPPPWEMPVVPGQSRNWMIVLALAMGGLVILSRDPAVRRRTRR